MERSAWSFFLKFLVESIRDLKSFGIGFQDGEQHRSFGIQSFDAFEIFLRERTASVFAGFQSLLHLIVRQLIEFERCGRVRRCR